MAGSQPDNKPKGRPRGRPWKKGESPKSPGRPRLAAEVEYRERIKVGCPPEDLEAIVRKAVQEAKRGGPVGAKARDWLARQLGTDAPVKIDQRVSATMEQRIVIADDAEADRLARELAARIYGPKPRAAIEAAVVQRDMKPENGTNGVDHA